MANEDNTQGGDQNPAGGKPKDNDEALGEGGLKALQAERAANKTAQTTIKELQDKLDSIEAEKLSKEEAAIKRAEKAEKERDELRQAQETEKLKNQVAKDHSDDDVTIPVHLLTGTTKEELDASATALKEFLGAATGPRRPAPDPNQGRNNDHVQTDDDTDALSVLGFGEQ
ncbi:scaffolding protein [Gordonia phage Dre3]|uniref:Scaffolding protein n=1 Tax=Gordonia phage Gibbous TaxID=2652405 RepID=A0A5J6T3U3_9CAUD|nr:scaffolding protein [Gordonia phage Gibbous]QFG05084.1 scaffolding protein [Gordonia phage Gibbous]QRI45936.1 scaffolding protein [Gordonia phage Dre3]